MIEPLHIAATSSTPEIIFNKAKNIFLIKGNVMPEDAFEMFSPIFKWFKKYAQTPLNDTILEIDVNIVNSSSTRRFIQLFKVIEEIAETGKNFSIKWSFIADDEVLQYAVYEFEKAFSKIHFNVTLK